MEGEAPTPPSVKDETDMIMQHNYIENIDSLRDMLLHNKAKNGEVDLDVFAKFLAEETKKMISAPITDKIKFSKATRGRFNFSGANYAIVMKGKIPVLMIPFAWYYDSTTLHKWAVMDADYFYGNRKEPIWKIWRRIKDRIVITTFSTTPDVAEVIPDGYMMRIDQSSKMQLPMWKPDTAEAQAERVSGEKMIGEVLTLDLELQALKKATTNFRLIIILLLIGAVVVIVLLVFGKNIAGILGGFAHSLTGSLPRPLG